MKRKPRKYLGLPGLTKRARVQAQHAQRQRASAPKLRIRFPQHLREPHPEGSYRQAKAQLRAMQRTARVLRSAQAKEQAVIVQSLRREQADLAERRRQANEGRREAMRQRREAERERQRQRDFQP